MFLRVGTIFLLTVLALSTVAAVPRRTLQETRCERVCRAARNNNAARIQRIDIEEGPDFCSTCTCSDGDGWTPMHVAARSGCHLCIDHLMTAPFNCDKMRRDVRGNTILHIGAQYCRTTVVAEAIDWYEFNIDLRSDGGVGDTALCTAAAQNITNCGGVARNLITGGANKCARCANGKTPCQNTVNDHIHNVTRQIRQQCSKCVWCRS